jgi:hypothetical protein
MFLHNLLNVLVQIANTMGLQKKLSFSQDSAIGPHPEPLPKSKKKK